MSLSVYEEHKLGRYWIGRVLDWLGMPVAMGSIVCYVGSPKTGEHF